MIYVERDVMLSKISNYTILKRTVVINNAKYELIPKLKIHLVYLL